MDTEGIANVCLLKGTQISNSLQRCQRILDMIKNHLELFNRHYAFHLRTWQLDGIGISPHHSHTLNCLREESAMDEGIPPPKTSAPIRVLLQLSGISEKVGV